MIINQDDINKAAEAFAERTGVHVLSSAGETRGRSPLLVIEMETTRGSFFWAARYKQLLDGTADRSALVALWAHHRPPHREPARGAEWLDDAPDGVVVILYEPKHDANVYWKHRRSTLGVLWFALVDGLIDIDQEGIASTALAASAAYVDCHINVKMERCR